MLWPSVNRYRARRRPPGEGEPPGEPFRGNAGYRKDDLCASFALPHGSASFAFPLNNLQV